MKTSTSEKSVPVHGRLLRRTVSLLTLAALAPCVLCGCSKSDSGKNENLDTSKDVKLTLAGPLTDFKAMETALQGFNDMYPNCTIEYEYLQDYKDILPTRLASDTNTVDIFITDNIQADSPFLEYSLELYSRNDTLDLSDTCEALVVNFAFLGSGSEKKIYAIPLGAEVRGLYVNTTLLDSLGIAVPTNKTELLEAARVMSEKGYMPFQGNPGNFSQVLMFPYITNIVASADDHDAVFNKINKCEDSAADLFREPMQLLYTLVEKNYYNYKYVESEFKSFVSADSDEVIRSFLNIADSETSAKKNDRFAPAFMPGTISMKNQLDKAIADYHSDIEYKFILSPVSDEGGYAYMSPSRGIAVNKNSKSTDWCLEFLDYIFAEKNNKSFTEEHNLIPNTKDAVEYISEQFDIPEGQITKPDDIAFDYGFYDLMFKPMIDVSKGNNPKYMSDDGSGNVSMYSFEYYMDKLKSRFKEQRETGELS